MSNPYTKYRAIVFDLDGTAIANSPHAMPSAKLINTILQYRNRIHLIAATGRPAHYAMPVINALQLTNLCIISGGAILIEPQSHEVVKSTTLPPKAVHEILRLVNDRPYRLFFRDEIIGSKVAAIHTPITEDVEIIYIAMVPASESQSLQQALDAIPDVSASAVPDWSGSGFAFNVTHQAATKEHAVSEALSRIGVASEQTIGVGDGANDLHLFRSVGLKVAMGNAAAELKAAADIIAPTVDEDGLAEIIERYA